MLAVSGTNCGRNPSRKDYGTEREIFQMLLTFNLQKAPIVGFAEWDC